MSVSWFVRGKSGRRATLVGLLAVVGVMLTLVSYSVTLYRLFCEATGAFGTTQRVAANASATTGRKLTVLFDTSVAPNLPWRFVPMQRKIELRAGRSALVFFEAENLSDTEIVGHATFNVTPEKAGVFFKKIECFCFTEERLAPHTKVQMPVQFFVDPAIGRDPNTADIGEITLAYTFFRSARPQGAADLARFANAPPDAEAGEQLFAEQCAGCHALDTARIGPPLGHVIGRRAGSVPGYPYSPALAQSGIVWSEATLTNWLAGPQAMVPGALMPMAVPEVAARRDIVAYLERIAAQANIGQAPAVPARPPG